MRRQVTAVRKSFVADFALEWLLTSVGAHMLCQIAARRE